MVNTQNVQISSENAVSNVAANPPASKVEPTSTGVVPCQPSNSTDTSTKTNENGRPNNKRSSIDNSFFNAIARRRITPFPEVESVIHSQSMTVADPPRLTEHISCSSSGSSLSDATTFTDEYNWMFHPMLVPSWIQHQWKDGTLYPCANQVALFNYGVSAVQWINQVLTTIQAIIDLNDTSIDCYRVGDYDASLEALREAESRRETLIPKSVAQRYSPMFHSSSSDRKPATVDNGNSKAVARSSYIYQRMDFDEGMHSYANLEKLDESDVMDYVSSEESQSGQSLIQVKNDVVQAILLFNVGQVHRRRGEFDIAAIKYESALETLREGNMLQIPLLIPILHNIGQLQYRRGELTKAMETYEMALAHAHSMEDGTVHVASTLNCLGVLHYHANSSENDDSESNDSKIRAISNSSTDKAMELFQQALALRKDCLGPDHVDVATTLNNIGRIHVQSDEFDKALEYYQDALCIRRVSLGTNSLDYAATAFNAGQSLHQMGQLTEAIELYHEFLRVASIKFGKSHRDVAVVLSGIAQIHQEQKNYDMALELYEESLSAGEAALGEYHSEIAMLLNRMGNFHFERERLSDALKCYKRGLRIEKKVLPPDHPNIVVTYSNLGEIHRQRSEWNEAATMYSEALEILKRKHAGEDNSEVATTLNTIGLIHDQRGEACLSLHYLQDALCMRRRLAATSAEDKDQPNLDVAATLVYIGTILYRKSLFPAAIELFTESLQIRQKILGKDHRDTAFVMYNIALVHQQRGDYDQSIEFYTETLRIEKVVLGERHKDVCMTLFKLGEVNKAAGKTAEALHHFQESLEIERNLSNNPSQVVGRRNNSNGPDPAAMARTLTEIGNIHLALGNVVPMMDAFNEASRLYRSAGLSPHNIVISGQHAYAIDFSFPEAAPAA
jgi:tetratricopeptide (TPR) repeat protein